jgi:beta-mannosidase
MLRMKKLFLLFFVCGLLIPAAAQLPRKIDLGGQWEFRKAGTKKWLPAKVPGCVQLDLLKNKVIRDPYYRTNEDSVQWIAESDWEYRKVFFLDPSVLATRNIDLVFEGLDTYADVFLNDSLIINADNMFREWSYENVKFKLQSGRNELFIRFPSVNKQNREIYQRMPIKLPGDEKVVCRKAAYNFGWDWGPKMVTMGIWKPVYLKLYNRLNLIGARFIQKKLTDSAAYMSAEFVLSSNLPESGSIKLNNDKTLLADYRISIQKGITLIQFDFIIKNPRLWWPNGMGAQNLYPLDYSVYLGDEEVSKGQQKIGLRTIELVTNKDSLGSTFFFTVNKVPVFIKGANYIPQDNFPTRVSDSAYRTLLTEARDLNMNMLRVWGGGIYEKDIFYDLCDELGIMVWQDFMFACAMYPGNTTFLQNVNAESAQNIVRLRRHPCLALWCGNNEIDEGWKNWGWIKEYKYSQRDSAMVYRTYQFIFDGILRDNVNKLDTLRPYIPSSPGIGWGNPRSRFDGDMHYWGVWWGKQPFTKYREVVGRFMSEYGFQGFPDINSFSRFAKPEDMKLGSAVMKAHQKHPTGYELIDEYMIRDFRRPVDFVSYVYVSQVLQAEGIKTAVEAHRRAMPYCMGTLFWQFNDCWPVVSWSARDYYGAPKALQYYLRKAYKDILVSTVIEKNRLKVYLVSDRNAATNGDLRVRITGFEGNIIRDTLLKIIVPRSSSHTYFEADSATYTKGIDPRKVVMTAVFTPSGNDPDKYRSNFYFTPVKDLDLIKPVIKKEISEAPGGYKIILSTDKLAKNLWLSTTVKGKFSENFSDLIPGIPLEIFFTTSYKAKDLQDRITIKTISDTY